MDPIRGGRAWDLVLFAPLVINYCNELEFSKNVLMSHMNAYLLGVPDCEGPRTGVTECDPAGWVRPFGDADKVRPSCSPKGGAELGGGMGSLDGCCMALLKATLASRELFVPFALFGPNSPRLSVGPCPDPEAPVVLVPVGVGVRAVDAGAGAGIVVATDVALAADADDAPEAEADAAVDVDVAVVVEVEVVMGTAGVKDAGTGAVVAAAAAEGAEAGMAPSPAPGIGPEVRL